METTGLRVRKTTCEKYQFRLNDGWDYVSFVIDDTGMLQCDGSFGSYAYQWRSFGGCFKTFLAKLNSDYLLRKLSNRSAFEGTVYVSEALQTILKLRREETFSKEEARLLWDYYIEELEVSDSFDLVFSQLYESSVFRKVGYDCVTYSEFEPELDYPRSAVYFVEKIFPLFQAVLREELKQKKEAI